MRDAVDSTIEQEQAELLALADAFAQSRADYFTRTATATLFPELGGIFGSGRRVRVMSAVNGVRSVYQAATGVLLAESLPGQPLMPSGGAGLEIAHSHRFVDGPYRPLTEESVGTWLQELLDEELIVEASDRERAMREGNCCGWIVDGTTSTGRTERRYLVTQSAITACVASGGASCRTVIELHHALSMLVEQGWLHTHVLHYHVEGVGPLAMYSFDGCLVVRDA